MKRYKELGWIIFMTAILTCAAVIFIDMAYDITRDVFFKLK